MVINNENDLAVIETIRKLRIAPVKKISIIIIINKLFFIMFDTRQFSVINYYCSDF